MAKHPQATLRIAKAATGVRGLDELAFGGLPAGKATVVIGAAGTGKTVFALQVLVSAAQKAGEPGIFVAFEENAKDIVGNAASFGWNLPGLSDRKLFFIDARLPVDVVQSGTFEFTGMLESIRDRAKTMRARWIAFDALDVLLDLLPDANVRQREVRRLQEWIEANELNCILTLKADSLASGPPAHLYTSYMAHCVIQLGRTETEGVVTRSLRILKYRGSAYAENPAPYLIGQRGIEILPMLPHTGGYKIYTDRVSTGMERLDAMLGGGLTRGMVMLLTGAPGTAKTTLAACFLNATCERGEAALYVGFDESGAEMVRNVRSVGIELGRHVKSGRLHLSGMASRARSGEALLAAIIEQLEAHKPRALVVDPLSALMKQGNDLSVADIAYRLVQQCKLRGVTVYVTSVVSSPDPQDETTELHISTLADAWIHLSYLIRAGERNRAITVVKARGTGHSNQVRELILNRDGITLADVYAEHGEVLMGTLRFQREAQVAEQRRLAAQARAQEHERNKKAALDLATRIRSMQKELKALERDVATGTKDEAQAAERVQNEQTENMRLRQADEKSANRK